MNRPMGQNRQPRNKLTLKKSTNLWQKYQEHPMGKGSLFNKRCWENWISACKRMNWTSSDTLCKDQLKWIKDLNLRPETVKLLEENIGRKLFDIDLTMTFCMWHRITCNTSKNKQVGLYHSKKFCTSKETINKMKGQPYI